MLSDLRHALRALRQRPGFAAVAIGTLAIGIGANATIFTLVSAILLRPLPFDDPRELVAVWPEIRVSKQEYVETRDAFRAYVGIDLWTRWGYTLTGEGEAEELDGVAASAGLFRTLGVDAALGRTFREGEDQPGRNAVVVLSDGLWRRRFGTDSAVVGRTILLDGEAHTVIGVMPPEFAFPERHRELFVPLAIDPSNTNDYPAHYLGLVGRLAEGWSRAEAQAELHTIIDRIRATQEVPEDFGWGASVIPLRRHLVGDVRGALVMLWVAVGLVLLLACANVGNLMLVRATLQERDLAVRTALGAGRARLLRSVLVDSLVLATLGALAGAVLAVWGLDILLRVLPAEIAAMGDIRVDPRVIGFLALVAMGSALLFGVMPALSLSKTDPAAALVERGVHVPGPRLRAQHGLVVAEIALATTLLVGAGLLVRSFLELHRVDPGFVADHALLLRLAPPSARYRGGDARRDYYERVVERVASLRGVRSVGGIVAPPLGTNNYQHELEINGIPVDEHNRPEVSWRAVTPDYFRAMGIPLLEGRTLDARDGVGGPPVALVNRALAREYFGNGNVVGREVRTGFDGSDWVTVVGVVGDVRQQSLDQPAQPELYRPFAQWPWFNLTLVVRTLGDPAMLAAALQREIWAIDENVPISDVRTLEQAVARSVSRPRFYAVLLGAFAGIGLLLGAVGIFGVLSFAVNLRRREIGVRMALGAARPQVLRMVLARGLLLTGLGLAIGMGFALVASGIMRGLLYGVRSSDPVTYGAVALVLLATATIATVLPARQASRVEPVEALRYE